MDEQDVLARVRQDGVPSYGDDEVLFMAATFADVWPDHVMDWGTNVGASARVWWSCAHVLGSSAQIHSVELPDDVAHREHPGTERYAMFLDGLPVNLYRGDGAEVACGLCAVLKPAAPLFFVDGDHETESVYRELSMIAEAAPDAVVLVHDTAAPHTRLAVDLFLGDGQPWEHELLESQAGMSRLWPRSA